MQQDRRSKTGQVTVYNLSGKRTEADTSYKRRIRLCFPVQGCIIMNMVPLEARSAFGAEGEERFCLIGIKL